MKQIKLEVGKTYRNREGEKVKIVKRANRGEYPFLGSNGEWYAESGKFDVDIAEPDLDLIKEVPETCHAFITPDEAKKVTATRHTFAIPDGVKEITLDYFGNRIVVEMVPTASPKPGDVMINKHDSVYIFKEVVDENLHTMYAWWGKTGRLAKTANLATCGLCLPGRPATPEEAQPLWDALKKAGKRWNPETMQVEDVPEIYRIREWVEENIKDGYYNQEDVAEAIEGYLKQKEDKQ